MEGRTENRVERKKRLPVGIDGFEKLRSNHFYYADKTMFISELLHNWGEVNLFTRPRRFGKSLNMSMLRAFFEIGCDRTLFDGLKITQDKELCESYMGKFPVIAISLKGVEGLSFEEARESLKTIIGKEAERFRFLADSGRLTQDQRLAYRALVRIREDGSYGMSEVAVKYSLQTLCALLEKHYGKKVIILIDEYDVPLDKAFQEGYYEEMLQLIRELFGNALKGNDSLFFAVLTGCLRISRESIFTGLNNLKVHTITDVRYDEYFGFTEQDVAELLVYYGLEKHAGTMQEWYDGYRFGDVSVYCPWDVINYCEDLLAARGRDIKPKNFWANTSGNAMVKRFLKKADRQTKNEIEHLIAGESIVKAINQELTYSEIDRTVNNLWSVLFTTGYLTQRAGRKPGTESEEDANLYELAIPNCEIRSLFVSQIRGWFRESAQGDAAKLEQFCQAFPAGDAELIERMLGDYLWNSISIRDTAVQIDRKENFYHGMLLGLLQYETCWDISSNTESGEGYSDIQIRTPEGTGVVIEVKYAQNGRLEKGCAEALRQIGEKRYDAELVKDGMREIVRYGIAFYKKRCRVEKE